MQIFARPNQNEETTKSPPADSFEIETDLERRRVFLRYINRAWLIFGIVTLLSLPVFPKQRAEFIVLIAAIFPSYLIIRFLNWSGKTRLAGVIFTLSVNFGFYSLFMVLVRELGASKAFETETTVWMLMGLAVLFAGAFVDKWAAPGLALINTILLIGTRLTIAPDSDPRPSALVFWWMMALTIWLYERTLGRSLGRLLSELAERKQVEAALRESENRFRTMADASPSLIWMSGPNKLCTYFNKGWLEFTGRTMEQELGNGWLEGIHPDDYEHCWRPYTVAFDARQDFRIEYRLRRYDGEYRWVVDDGKPMFAGDEFVGYIGSCVDITERKHAEELLQEAESKYRNLVERLSQVIYTSELGTNGVWAYASPKIEQLLGYTPQEWLADSTLWYQQVHPEDRDKQLLLEDEAYINNEPFEGEYRILTRTGNWIWVHDSGHILLSQSGGPPIVQGVLMDITERKRAEEDLSLSKTQLLANLEYTPNVAVQWYDKDGHVLYWNPASESMYGWKSINVIGKKLDQLIYTPKEQVEFMHILAEVQATGEPFGPYEARIRRHDNTTGWVLATTFSIPMNDEQIGFVCMDVDITERKQAEEQYQKQLRRLNALHTVDMAINSGANIEIILEVLLNQALSQLNADAADVLLYNQTAQILELGAERGFRSNITHPSHQRLGDFHAGQIINQRSTLHIQNMTETGKHLKQTPMLAGESFIDYVGVPLIAKGQIKGVLEIYQRSPLDANAEWLNFLEVLAGQAAIAIDNSQLLQGLQKSTMEIVLAYDATIEGWSHAMDLRDKETEGHTQRVTAMTLQLAQAIGIREADIIHIQRGGLLHDIGKIGVPDGILLKPGKLTDDEWEIMRQHPTFAFNMPSPISYLKNAIDIPYCHHEKWDGTGYPRRLKGEQIPLAARIFAIADVWDALTSDRPYRKAWSKEQTVEYIKEQSGSHFDPQIVGVFLKMISK